MKSERSEGDLVCAVMVTYQPEMPRVRQILRAVGPTVYRAIVVDNGSAGLDEKELVDVCPNALVVRLPENRGIGAAQNEGIAMARSTGAAYILFLDQDSAPESGMVSELLAAFTKEASRGTRVGCVGPRVRLTGSKALSVFRRVGWIGLQTMPCTDADTVVECDFLISSGTLVPLAVLDDVGGLEEGLFIDQVDTEWCLRARSKGYRIFGACGAVLEHKIGETEKRMWLGRWRRLPRHRPFRYYYIFRNTILLSRRGYVPTKYALFFLKWLVALLLMYGIFTRDRHGELGMMLRGVADGIRGVTGRLELQ